jgi:BirA family biotin operon repressor/biotin-[acetyl-CoA-carboxylase] ligase
MTVPREHWSLETRRLGRRVLVFDCLDSTNNHAALLAGDPANEGIAVLADEQSAGRGQHGRTWLAAPGDSVQRPPRGHGGAPPPGDSVLLSVLVTPPPELCRPVVLTAWAAVAVCATVRQTVGWQARIKWPNDVFLHGKKVCGILIEGVAAERRQFIAGIGLNVRQSAATFAAAGLPEATALAQFTDHLLETPAVARELIRQLDHDYDLLCQGDLGTLEACWKWHLGLLDRPVLAECHGVTYSGRLCELSFNGVELERPDGARLVVVPERIQHLSVAQEL